MLYNKTPLTTKINGEDYEIEIRLSLSDLVVIAFRTVFTNLRKGCSDIYLPLNYTVLVQSGNLESGSTFVFAVIHKLLSFRYLPGGKP